MLTRRGFSESINWGVDGNGILKDEDLFIAFIDDKKIHYKNFFEKLIAEKKKIYSFYIFIFVNDKDRLVDDEYTNREYFHMSDFYMDVVDDAPKPHYVSFKKRTLEYIKQKEGNNSIDWKVDDFPKMKRTDPLAKYFGAKIGDIYEIKMANEVASYYRVII